jgi:hypothetical protein
MKTYLLLCSLCLALLVASAASAGIYDFYGPWAFGWGYGGYGQPSQCYYECIPYYALHPPVYYSYRIDARSYGDSPFPYPPGLTALQAYPAVAGPQTIRNEYVEEANLPSDQYQTRAPLRIPNPFVEQPQDAGSPTRGTKWEVKTTSKPLVIYPAKKALWTQREKSVSYQPLR